MRMLGGMLGNCFECYDNGRGTIISLVWDCVDGLCGYEVCIG
jgi:hypothetical protein